MEENIYGDRSRRRKIAVAGGFFKRVQPGSASAPPDGGEKFSPGNDDGLTEAVQEDVDEVALDEKSGGRLLVLAHYRIGVVKYDR